MAVVRCLMAGNANARYDGVCSSYARSVAQFKTVPRLNLNLPIMKPKLNKKISVQVCDATMFNIVRQAHYQILTKKNAIS
jgi:hypothetical protein